MKIILALAFMLASHAGLKAQPAVTPAPASEAVASIRAAHDAAKAGSITDLAAILVTARNGMSMDRTCDQLGRICSAKVAAIDLLATWVENWAGKCLQSTLHNADLKNLLDLRAQLEAFAASVTITAASTREERERAKRLQDALDKLQRCPSMPDTRIWFASVAPDIPTHVKEQWMVNCGPTPYGRWTIMRTEGPAAAALEILGGVLELKENGKGEYTLNGIGKSNRRGAYKETGIAEFSAMPGAPGQFLLVLRGIWSDRVADGRGGWVAKNFKFGDISFQAEQRSMPCPVAQSTR